MKTLKYITFVLIAVSMTLTGCKLDTPTNTSTPFSAGDADFSRYVAVGNSLTAGYQSAALTQIFQEVSFPAMIAKQAKVENFVQPLLGYPGLGNYSDKGYGILRMLYLDNPQTPNTVNPDPVIAPMAFSDYGYNPMHPFVSDEIQNYPYPYNNLGIPGATVGEMVDSTAAAGGFFTIVLRSNYSAMQLAIAQSPTFITCWAGNNDVLGYATHGGADALLTPLADFTTAYQTLIGGLSTTGADIVVANIPDVTAIPFFTTIPPVVLNPETNSPVLGEDGNPVYLLGVNPATDLVLLTAADAMKAGFGIPVSLGGNGQDLPDAVVLDADEIAVAKQAVADFNAAISDICAAKDIPVVDVNSFLNDVAVNGYEYNGFKFTNKMVTGGLFSYDGVHPSTAGYAIIANLWIDKINEHFNASIPYVNVLDYMKDIPAPAPSGGGAAAKSVSSISYAGGAERLISIFR